ncbi:MAG: hypothetical protein MJ141_06410, partial [Clostridia bacterium]|nr:hypothetical protein [Clostridia bacterium]
MADLDRLGRIKSVIPAGDGYDVYYMTGSSAKIAHLDHDLEMQETRDAPLPSITAAFLRNGEIYYLADAEEDGKTVYGVYRGTELLYTLPTVAYAEKCQMAVTDDALYTCTEIGIEMKISANASSIALAEPDDPMVRRYIGGLVSIGTQPYAVVWQFSEPEMEVMEDYRTYFVPLSSDMTEIKPEGDYFAGAITDGMCASGKENAYGIEGTDFYRVTPEGRDILFNLSVLGISRNGILDITEGADGEFLFLMQTGLIVVRKRTAEDMKTAPTEIALGVIWESEIYSTSSMEYVISQFN